MNNRAKKNIAATVLVGVIVLSVGIGNIMLLLFGRKTEAVITQTNPVNEKFVLIDGTKRNELPTETKVYYQFYIDNKVLKNSQIINTDTVNYKKGNYITIKYVSFAPSISTIAE